MKCENIILKKVLDRLHRKDKNYLCIICGETGSGKSETAIEFARRVDPNFSLDNIVFSVKEFFDLLNTDKLKRGSAVVWEELGISADNRQFFSLQNRAITYAFETFRHHNLAVFMTVPALSMIDLRVRNLSHQYLETMKINYGRKVCTCKVYDLQYSSRYSKLYFKYPKTYINGVHSQIKRVYFSKPPDSIAIPYQSKKKEFTKTLNLGLVDSLERKVEKEKNLKIQDDEFIIKEVERRKDEFIVKDRSGRERISGALIRQVFKLPYTRGNDIRSLAEKNLGL